MGVVLIVEGRTVELTATESTIGRAEGCAVVLGDRSVSRQHAVIALTATGAIIRDLGSRNGTWVNGLRIMTDRRLRASDRVRIGCSPIIVSSVSTHLDRDEGWLVVQSTLLLKENAAGRMREADEILFRVAETIETRMSLGDRFSDDVSDAALAAIIDYATARKRPGWIRWALSVQAKLGLVTGDAIRRSLEHAAVDDPTLRSSGTVPAARPVSTRRTG